MNHAVAYGPDLSHRVIGDEWPEARNALEEIGRRLVEAGVTRAMPDD